MKRLTYLSVLFAGACLAGDTDYQSVAAQDADPKPAVAAPAATAEAAAQDPDKPAAAAAAAADPEAAKLATALRPKLLEYLKKHPELGGVLIVPDTDLTTELQVTITVIIDKDDTEFTKDDVDKIIAEDTATALYQLELKRHPVKEILSQLQLRLKDDAELKNCKVESVTYEADDAGALSLALRGLFILDGQRAALGKACNEIIVAVYDKDPALPLAKTDTLRKLAEVSEAAIKAAAELENALLAEIRSERKGRVIHGASVRPYRDPATEDERFDVTVVVDREHKEVSLAKVEEKAAKHLPEDSYGKIIVQPHPVLAVLEGLRKEIAKSPKYEGCCIDDIYYAPEDGKFVVRLQGAFTKDTHRADLIVLRNEVLSDAYAPDDAPPGAETDTELVLLPPDDKLIAVLADVEKQLQVIVRKAPDIYGAILTSKLDPCTRMTSVKIVVIVDEGKKDVSLDAIKALAAKKLPAGSFDVPELLPHPVIAVLTELRKVIAKTPGLTGCRIEDADFVTEKEGGLAFSLRGELAKGTQRINLAQLCNTVLSDIYKDTELAPLVVQSTELTVAEIPADILVAKMNVRMKGKRGLTGGSISSAKYTNGGKEFEMSVTMGHGSQRAAILQEANAVLTEEYGDDHSLVPTAGDVKIVYLPVDELLAELQRRVELDSNADLGGCQINRIKYSGEAGAEAVEVMGRIASADQRALLATLAQGVIEQMYDANWPKASTGNLQLIPSSPEVAAEFFNVGLTQFTKGDFVAAQKSFAQAVLENPRRIENKYWLIAAEVGQGKTEQAYERLRPMTHGRRAGDSIYDSRYVGVLSSLERVQGPIRYKMRQLELRAFVEGLAPAATPNQ